MPVNAFDFVLVAFQNTHALVALVDECPYANRRIETGTGYHMAIPAYANMTHTFLVLLIERLLKKNLIFNFVKNKHLGLAVLTAGDNDIAPAVPIDAPKQRLVLFILSYFLDLHFNIKLL